MILRKGFASLSVFGDCSEVVWGSAWLFRWLVCQSSLDGFSNFFSCETLRIFRTPSLSINIAFPSFWITLYGVGSKLVSNLFSQLCFNSTPSPSSIMLWSADRFTSAYSFCLSLFLASLSLNNCCHSASVARSLGTVKRRSLSRNVRPIRSLAGEGPVVVWGVVLWWKRKFSKAVFQFEPSRLAMRMVLRIVWLHLSTSSLLWGQ